jgi:beta-glucanase (GH16 family)
MRWWRPALGVAIVLAIGVWDVGIPGKQARPDRQGATPSESATSALGLPQPKGAPEFSATFTGSRLDTSVWATCYPWMDMPTGCRNFGNHEYEWYLPSQAQVYGGALHLVAQHTPTDGRTADGRPKEYECRSGMVTSYPGLRFKYGYIQIVARIPTNPGLWPALWLAAADLHWPPEMDISESWGGRGGTSFYTAEYFHPVGAKQVKAVVPPQLAFGWHAFALSWTKTQMTWFLDGRAFLTVHQRIPHQKMYFIADLAEFKVPTSTVQCEGSLLIRSVKVWKN